MMKKNELLKSLNGKICRVHGVIHMHNFHSPTIKIECTDRELRFYVPGSINEMINYYGKCDKLNTVASLLAKELNLKGLDQLKIKNAIKEVYRDEWILANTIFIKSIRSIETTYYKENELYNLKITFAGGSDANPQVINLLEFKDDKNEE